MIEYYDDKKSQYALAKCVEIYKTYDGYLVIIDKKIKTVRVCVYADEEKGIVIGSTNIYANKKFLPSYNLNYCFYRRELK